MSNVQRLNSYTIQIYVLRFSIKLFIECKVSQKKKAPMYFKTNYRIEMKLVPIMMEYCLLQSDALNFFLGVHLHGGGSTYL